MAIDSFIFGGNTGLTYEQLKRRRAVALALASQRRGFPKTVGEGMTYLGESIGDMIAERRLDAAERGSAAYGANLRREIEGGPAAAPTAAPVIPPAAPRPPTPIRAPAAPAPPRPASAAPPATTVAPAPSITMMPVRPDPGDPYGATEGTGAGFAPGEILNPAPMAAPGLQETFPGEEGAREVMAGPSSGYLPPAATAAAPSIAPAPQAAPSAPASPELQRAQEFQRSQGRPVTNAAGVPLDGAPAAPAAPVGPQSGLTDFIAKQEGYRPTAYWDYKQYSIGHGTRGQPGETISREEAGRRLESEVANARQEVENFAPNAPPGVKDALTSLTYNAGSGWQQAGLGRLIREGRYDEARERFAQYNKAGGSTLPGLVSRRNAELSSFWDQAGGGEQEARTMLASLAPTGGAGAPIPGMGSAGAPRLQPQIPPLQGPPQSPDEQVTPTDIEPMPTTAQFGPPVGRFTRSDAPVVGLPPATAAPAPGMVAPVAPAPDRVEGRLPPAPAAPPAIPGSRPSQEPIPPATPQTMADPGPPPQPPAPRPRTPTQQRILQALGDPRLDPNGPDAALLKDRFAQDEAERLRLEKIDTSDYTSKREGWEKRVIDKEKFDREAADRNMKQQAERVALEENVLKIEKALYETTVPREQERLKNELAIAEARLKIVAPETYSAGGTHFARPRGSEGAVNVIPGLPQPKEEPLTEAQQSGLLFAMRVRPDLDRVDTHYNKGKVLTDPIQVGKAMLPGGNALVSDEYRTVRDSLGNWGAGFLSKVSGMAITPGEAHRQLPAFVPQVGDTEKQLEEKATRRRDFTTAVEKIATPGGLKTIKEMMDRVNADYALDVKARDWAEKNPGDPRAADIKRRLGIK